MTFWVRGAVLDGEGRVFLVKLSIRAFPAGTCPAAVSIPARRRRRRSARELAGGGHILLTGPAELQGLHLNREVSRRDHAAFYIVRAFEQTAPRGADDEIAACGFFPLDALPEDAGRRRRGGGSTRLPAGAGPTAPGRAAPTGPRPRASCRKAPAGPSKRRRTVLSGAPCRFSAPSDDEPRAGPASSARLTGSAGRARPASDRTRHECLDIPIDLLTERPEDGPAIDKLHERAWPRPLRPHRLPPARSARCRGWTFLRGSGRVDDRRLEPARP